MTLASTMLITARRLLRTYGQSISFARVVEGAFVPSTGATASGTNSTYTAYGAPMPNTGTVSTIGVKELQETTIKQQDNIIFVEVNDSSTIPLIGDVATLNTVAYRVISIQQYAVQGSTLLYKLTVRI
jgi:hypothetical protein